MRRIREAPARRATFAALQLLEEIKDHRITIAIDDFGTGHSSLAYSKRFPVDSVTIDYEFVRDIADDPNDVAITKAIIALGRSLGLKVVAKGVETPTQLDILRQFRCDAFPFAPFSRCPNCAVPAPDDARRRNTRDPEAATRWWRAG